MPRRVARQAERKALLWPQKGWRRMYWGAPGYSTANQRPKVPKKGRSFHLRRRVSDAPLQHERSSVVVGVADVGRRVLVVCEAVVGEASRI